MRKNRQFGIALGAVLLLPTLHAARAQEDIAAYRAEHDQLQRFAEDCQRQMYAFNQRQAAAAAQGYLLPQPPCTNQMPGVIARMGFLETRIYRAETGDYRTPSATLNPNLSPNARGPSGGGASPSDPAGRYDRGSIRGTWRYRGEDGSIYELPIRDYYFRNRASGAIIGSDSADPPDYQNDYERLEPAE